MRGGNSKTGAIQMESSAPPCVECKGSGTVVVRATGCTHSQPCPCDHGAQVCPNCEGSKVEACEGCGEPSSHLRYDGDYVPKQPFCDECDPEEPRGDHPLGGMGYRIDYEAGMASGRLLK